MQLVAIDAEKPDNVLICVPSDIERDASNRRRRVSQNFSLHESYHDEDPAEVGGDRAFGCTVGSVLMVIGTAKMLAAATILLVPCLMFVAGALLLLFGILAPARLSGLNRAWQKVGGALAKVVNPVVLALLFFVAVTPMAFVMRMLGKRPLRLAPDRTAATYWIKREPPGGGESNMRRQF
jgi:Saxitoxin biosynthesis operon protein SxtJ